jgi:hypothetical protein
MQKNTNKESHDGRYEATKWMVVTHTMLALLLWLLPLASVTPFSNNDYGFQSAIRQSLKEGRTLLGCYNECVVITT